MYARNLGKSGVRASPLPKYSEYLTSGQPKDENSYRYHIPPGYVGSRFSNSSSAENDMEVKRHTAPSDTRNRPVTAAVTPENRQDTLLQDTGTETVPEEWDEPEESDVLPVPADEKYVRGKEDRTEQHPSGLPDTINGLFNVLKDRVSGEDILLIVIILTLALAGEDAEITILLLSLLLLIK